MAKMNRGRLTKKYTRDNGQVYHMPNVNKQEAFAIMAVQMGEAKRRQEKGLPAGFTKPKGFSKGHRGKHYPRGQEPGCDHEKLAEMRNHVRGRGK